MTDADARRLNRCIREFASTCRNAGKDRRRPEQRRRDDAGAFSCSTRRAVPPHSPPPVSHSIRTALAADALALVLLAQSPETGNHRSSGGKIGAGQADRRLTGRPGRLGFQHTGQLPHEVAEHSA
jgi:hypothetical protein